MLTTENPEEYRKPENSSVLKNWLDDCAPNQMNFIAKSRMACYTGSYDFCQF